MKVVVQCTYVDFATSQNSRQAMASSLTLKTGNSQANLKEERMIAATLLEHPKLTIRVVISRGVLKDSLLTEFADKVFVVYRSFVDWLAFPAVRAKVKRCLLGLKVLTEGLIAFAKAADFGRLKRRGGRLLVACRGVRVG